MAKVSSIKRLIKEDFEQEDQPLIDKIAYPINQGFETLVSALNRNLTFDDNMNAQTKTLSGVEVDGSGIPTTDLKYNSSLKSSTKGIICLRAENTTTPSSYVSSAPFISYTESGGVVTIKRINGLSSGSKYTLYILAIGL